MPDHIKKTGVLEVDQNSIEKAISELVQLNLLMNKKTPRGLDLFYRASRNKISISEMENLATKENTINSLPIVDEVNSNADENIFSDLINSETPPPK